MNAFGINASKGKSLMAIMRPFGEPVAKSYEVRHTSSKLSGLAASFKIPAGETLIVSEHTGRCYTPYVYMTAVANNVLRTGCKRAKKHLSGSENSGIMVP